MFKWGTNTPSTTDKPTNRQPTMKPTPPQITTTQTIKNVGSPTKTINNAPPKKQL